MNFVELGVYLARYVLLAFSVASLTVVIERALTLRRIRRLEDEEYGALKTMLARRLKSDALARLATSPAPCAGALQSGLDLEGASNETRREALAQGIEVQNALLRRNLPLLATVASTAPYVGLFGTVLGILLAFDRIAKTNQTGASVVAQPIAEALTATALGLGVAIPAVMFYNYFSGRINDLALRVQTHALDLAARLELPAPVAASNGSVPHNVLPVAPMTSVEHREEIHAS